MKNTYTTLIKAINPITKELNTFVGPDIEGISIQDAQHYCENNGFGYCEVDSLLISKIPADENTFEAKWNERKDYNQHLFN
jgi:hypothetical protein